MVISVLQYGLGNQLFQYAAGRAVADRLHATLLLDVTRFGYVGLRALDIHKLRVRTRRLPDALAKLLTPDGGTNRLKARVKTLAGFGCRTLVDPEQGYDPRILDLAGFCRLDGYWQSERYFTHLRPQLLAELEPIEGLSAPLAAFSQRLETEESIALHVRRGDLVTDPVYVRTVGSLRADHYEEALMRLKARLGGNARVYVFSDDPDWCAENLPRVFPMEIVSGKMTRSALEDLAVMRRCRHFVIANSTFSWWAAWLGNHPSKQVIAPARFFREPRTLEKDLLPTTWETLSPLFEDGG